jgi:hypothetical protein
LRGRIGAVIIGDGSGLNNDAGLIEPIHHRGAHFDSGSDLDHFDTTRLDELHRA